MSEEENTPDVEYTMVSHEFTEKYGKLSSRLTRLKITQRSTVMEVRDKVIALYPEDTEFNNDALELFSTMYVFLTTEEILLVHLSAFIKDMSSFSKFKGFSKPLFNMDIDIDGFIQNCFEPFVVSLSKASDIISSLSNWLIVRLGSSSWSETLTASYAINEYLKPMMKDLIITSPNVDVRYLAALGYFIVEDFITRKKRINSGEMLIDMNINTLYQSFIEKYPLDSGSDLAFDISYNLLFKPLWPSILNQVKEEVESLKEKIEEERETMKRESEKEKERLKHQYSDEYYMSSIGMRLYEFFNQNQSIDIKKKDIITHSFDVLARRIAIDKFGYISAEPDKIQLLVIDLLIETCKDYPQIFIPLLSQSEIISLRNSDSASKWIDSNIFAIRERFRAYLTKKVRGTFNVKEIANQFVFLIETAKKSRIKIEPDQIQYRKWT